MSNGFWDNLKKPILVLAPMADVTDVAFRRVIAKYGKPDVMWTEFVSADGLARAPEEGRKKLLKDLEYSEAERPIVAQFFTANPVHMEHVAKLACDLGFDGIDINMGCPDKTIEKHKSGAALIKTPKLAKQLIRAAKRGVESSGKNIPVSVKTRAGYNKVEIEEWIPELLAEEPAVLILHARTRKEMSKVPAQWELVNRAVEIRNELGSKTLIFGNGDIKDLNDARQKIKESGADGAMLGRAIFGNPWLFAESTPTLKEKLEVLVEHTKLFEEHLVMMKNFSIMKKHYKAYVNGFDGANELRGKLMETNSASEVEEIIQTFIQSMSM